MGDLEVEVELPQEVQEVALLQEPDYDQEVVCEKHPERLDYEQVLPHLDLELKQLKELLYLQVSMFTIDL